MDAIIALLNESGRWLIFQLGRMSLELFFLAAIVLAVLYILRVKSPAVRHLFLGLLLAKPVVTFLVASPLSLYAFPGTPIPEFRTTQTPRAAEMQTPQVAAPVQAVSTASSPAAAQSPRVEPPPPKRKIDGYGITSALWAVAASVLGLRLLLGCAYVAFLRSTALNQSEGTLSILLGEAAGTLKIRRRVRIAVTRVTHGPVLVGIFRPVILLPESMAGELTIRQIKLVIMHELAHARRWDNLVLLIQRFAEMFFFFHPVIWFCGWMMRREAEAACDDIVVSACGDLEGPGAAAYADSLTRVAEMKCGITRRLLVNAFAAAESNFSRRINRILSGRSGKPALWLSMITGAVLILIGALGLPAAYSAPRQIANAEEPPRLELRWVLGADESGDSEEMVSDQSPGMPSKTYRVATNPMITEKDVASAVNKADTQSPEQAMVLIQLWPESGERLLKATRSNVGRELAVIVDGRLVNAAVVRDGISENFCITGFTPAKAAALAKRFNAYVLEPSNQFLSPPQGTVLDVNGLPAVGANVLLLPSGTRVKGPQDNTPQAGTLTKTTGEGKFEFSPVDTPYLLLCESDTGCARVTGEQLQASNQLQLKPFARVEGTAFCGPAPYKDRYVALVSAQPSWRVGQKPGEEVQYLPDLFVKTGDQGQYVFDRVPEGRYAVCYTNEEGTVPVLWAITIAEAKAGETVRCGMGEPIGSVKGQLALGDWKWPQPELTNIRMLIAWGANISLNREPDTSEMEALNKFSQTGCGRQFVREAVIPPDGSFAVEGLPAGHYYLHFTEVPKGLQSAHAFRDVYSETSDFTITQEKKDIDIGEIRLKPVDEGIASRARRTLWESIGSFWR